MIDHQAGYETSTDMLDNNEAADRYPRQWILMEVTGRKRGWPIGRVVYHHPTEQGVRGELGRRLALPRTDPPTSSFMFFGERLLSDSEEIKRHFQERARTAHRERFL